MKYILGIIAALILLSCATPMTQRGDVEQADVEREAALQKEIFVKNYMKNRLRLSNVAYPILANNVDLCSEKTGSNFGILIDSPDTAGEEYSKTFSKLYGYGDYARITGIVKNGPAEQADIKIGDAIESIAGKPFTDTSSKGVVKMLEAMSMIAPGTPTVFELNRNSGWRLEVVITPIKACDYPVTMVMDDRINAFADGKSIYMTKGMMRFVENDNELALVVGHELAHNTMKHMSAKKKEFLARYNI